ncbi:MAG: hypothetical protein ACKOF7_08840, partial [Phycisphaerales bacterium]
MLALLVTLLAPALPAGFQSPAALPSAPQVVAPRETPSGARSPARIKLTRKGAVTRRALTGAPAQPVQPSPTQPTAPAGTVPFTPITTP